MKKIYWIICFMCFYGGIAGLHVYYQLFVIFGYFALYNIVKIKEIVRNKEVKKDNGK